MPLRSDTTTPSGYTKTEDLALGGEALVYRAKKSGIDVVIKEFKKPLSSERIKTLNDAIATAIDKINKKLTCLEIVFPERIYEELGKTYSIQPFVDGYTLSSIFVTPDAVTTWPIQSEYEELINSTSLRKRLRLASTLVAAFHYLHSSGYLHGDVSLANVMVSKDFERLYLIDNEGITSEGIGNSNLKSFAFGHPEIFKGVSIKTESFSVAILAFYIILGRHPFIGSNFLNNRNDYLDGDEEIDYVFTEAGNKNQWPFNSSDLFSFEYLSNSVKDVFTKFFTSNDLNCDLFVLSSVLLNSSLTIHDCNSCNKECFTDIKGNCLFCNTKLEYVLIEVNSSRIEGVQEHRTNIQKNFQYDTVFEIKYNGERTIKIKFVKNFNGKGPSLLNFSKVVSLKVEEQSGVSRSLPPKFALYLKELNGVVRFQGSMLFKYKLY